MAARKERNLTPTEVRERLREQRGYAMAHSTYAMIESGSRLPTDEQREHLVGFFGSEPEPEAQPVQADAALAAVLEAVRLQTAELHQLWKTQHERADRADARMDALVMGLRDLVEQMREDRQERAGRTGVAAESLGRLEGGVARLLELATESDETVEPRPNGAKDR